MDNFRVNEYITLKLTKGKYTTIFINGQQFKQCKRLLINLPSDNTNFYDVVESVDDFAEVQSEDETPDLELKAKDEFWGHCSVRHEAVLLNAET
ncbi:hypothetical protein LCGC14_1721610 [marine sediment metagenome]|uniref:Uncharacterized protein n=1 Tax=marine sediment metagenome TaxID=412755 RepID=A0A0F9KBY6_9ZZZZ